MFGPVPQPDQSPRFMAFVGVVALAAGIAISTAIIVGLAVLTVFAHFVTPH